MQPRITFCVALFCLACALIGMPAVAGLFPNMTTHAGPRASEDIRHAQILTGMGDRAGGDVGASSIGFSWPGSGQWIEAPTRIRRSCRPMGRSFSTQNTRTLRACLTV